MEAEIKAMYDVPSFIKQSKQLGYDNFINDAGGSLCELGDKILYQLLAKNTLIVYIKTNKDAERMLIERSKTSPNRCTTALTFLSPLRRLFLIKTAWTMLPK